MAVRSITLVLLLASTTIGAAPLSAAPDTLTYPIVDTGQAHCYDARGPIRCTSASFAGQDAWYAGNEPAYQTHDDGTITDRVTGLMWQQSPGPKATYSAASRGAERFSLAGYDDWRLPSIKELYSLVQFSGTDPSPCGRSNAGCSPIPFIDDAFDFSYGDPQAGERLIDAQFVSSTRYVGTTMGGRQTVFGVNFADGRIKGYPTGPMRHQPDGKLFSVLYVRGGAYGLNDFVDRGDGTVADRATGLTWAQEDSGAEGRMTWAQALTWAEDLDLGGRDDWRLPNAKELQSLVDYSRSPATTGSAAIDPVFQATSIVDEGGGANFDSYWTSTTHISEDGRGATAAYVAFGEALGWMRDPRSGQRELMDVHGAGAQRSDPKAGDATRFPYGRGPQGDVIRVRLLVRAVRGGAVTDGAGQDPATAPGADEARALSRMTARADQGDQRPPKDGDRQKDGDRPKGPPKEAVAACAEASKGDACSFEGRRGETLTGTCQSPEEQLACVPKGHRGPPRR